MERLSHAACNTFLADDLATLVALRTPFAAASTSLAGLGGTRSEGAGAALAQALQAGVQADWSAWEELIRSEAARCVQDNVPLEQWYSTVGSARRILLPAILEAGRGTPELLCQMVDTAERLLECLLASVQDEYRLLRERAIAALRQDDQQARIMSERRFARLAESGIIGILVCDIFGNIKDANEAFTSMVGYTREELATGVVRWSEMTPPEWAYLDERAVQQLKQRGFTRTWEKEYFRKDGSRVPILVGVAMLDDTDCIAFVLDVTERRHLEELRLRSAELEAQNHRILESNRLQHEFLANMSHELRTPLNSIIGFADVLYDGEVPAESPKQREFLGHILKSGKHLLQVINDVLDLAKVEAGKLEFFPEELDVRQLIDEVVAVLHSPAEGKGVRVDVRVDEQARNVTLDPNRLKQVLYNYTSNALKFTAPGGVVTVSARAHRSDSIQIEVADTGIGIAEADLGRLFVQFQQLDSGTTKRHAGTGLGLALTKRIVEAQGGTVGVESAPGKGSRFFAVLPRYAAIRCVSDVVELAANPHGTPVLVVEDDARDRSMLAQILANAGYHVETANTGAHAIAACSQRPFDAITLDLLLPDMTGLDVLHRLRNEGQNRDTPVVVVSVASNQGVVAGFAVQDYLRKPVNGSELLASLLRARVLPNQTEPILVVDDDAAACELMRAVISQRGFNAKCCLDGEAALALIAVQRPAAIILDLLMPKLDGFEFLRRFRSQREHLTIPVIVWTMKDLSADDHARLRGMVQSVVEKCQTKPIALVDQIRSLLHARAEQPQREHPLAG